MTSGSRAARKLKNELLTVLLVLSLPTALLLHFPFAALDYHSPATAASRSFAASFVELSPQAQRAALQASKSEWQAQSAGSVLMRADIPMELPDDEVRGLSSAVVPSAPAMPEARFVPALLPRSCAAPPPERIPVAAEDSALAFPREEFLQLD